MASLEQFAAFTGLDLPPEQGVLLLGLASAVVRSYCGWHLAPAVEEVLVADGSGGLVQPLPTGYLAALYGVWNAGRPVRLDRVWWSSAGYLQHAHRPGTARWTGRPGGVAADVRHGYEQPPLEVSAVVLAAAGRAARAALAAGAVPAGVASETVGPFSRTYTRPDEQELAGAGGLGLTVLERAILDRYRLPNPP